MLALQKNKEQKVCEPKKGLWEILLKLVYSKNSSSVYMKLEMKNKEYSYLLE